MKTPLKFKTIRRQILMARTHWRREASYSFRCGFSDGGTEGLMHAAAQAYYQATKSPNDRMARARHAVLLRWAKGRGALRKNTLTYKALKRDMGR